MKNHIEKGNLEVEYCPNEETISGFMRKPFQGKIVQKSRKLIMGY